MFNADKTRMIALDKDVVGLLVGIVIFYIYD